ncbi:hypothetical protein KUCAC02_031510, partial [Chaenocephalus aceratus]
RAQVFWLLLSGPQLDEWKPKAIFLNFKESLFSEQPGSTNAMRQRQRVLAVGRWADGKAAGSHLLSDRLIILRAADQRVLRSLNTPPVHMLMRGEASGEKLLIHPDTDSSFTHPRGSSCGSTNLRAIPGSSKVPGLTSSHRELDHLAFHLHGGNTFGRGIRVLPEDCPDVQEMKRVMEACPEDD